MNIASTQYSLQYESFEIYLSGCDGKCSDKCHNKELWDFNVGKDFLDELPSIIDKINKNRSIIKSIWIMGGEPLLQAYEDLDELLNELSHLGIDMWLWTRFDIRQIPPSIRDYFDYIKCGQYDETKLTDNNIQYGIKLASSNQKIIKL